MRSAGVSDIADFVAGRSDPLPRLFVAIDEFAALATELPDFMNALVGIAQRGRSLGVHLLLATQRPNGVIDDKIRANTNLRMALRVQDVGDSVDVVGTADAAAISRTQPGRALARLGPADTVAFQTALVTGHSLAEDSLPVTARPFVFGSEPGAGGIGATDRAEGPSDLEVIVAAANRVADRLRLPAARLPWPDPLPASITLGDLPHLGASPAAFAIADEPHRQRQVAAEWTPAAGNLLLYGLPGSGTTTALATLAIATARAFDPNRLHIYAFDFDDQLLQPLRDLPQVGAVVAGGDRERQLRLLRRLGAELQHRRQATAEGMSDPTRYPTIVALLDNFGGFADSYAEPGDMAVHNLVARLIADGPGVGIVTVVTAKHPGDIPTRIASTVGSRLVFRLADRYDYSGLGVPPIDPPKQPGRAFESGSGRELQVALPHEDGIVAAVIEGGWSESTNPPWQIDVLPSEVPIAEFISRGRIAADEWYLPLGIGDSSLVPVGLMLRDGEHALIAGPARSGKTTALATLATVARAADPSLRIAAITPRRSELGRCGAVDAIVDPGDLADLEGRSMLLLVDDAELVGGGDALSAIIATRDPSVRIIASGNADAIRGRYGHWTQELRRSRIGCALRPNPVSDGDLWQIQLPRSEQQSFPAGRGYLVSDGRVELVQLGRS
jgi:S-DNA-T family DNA segregation ATPase FtsK/SpoIIIE